MSHIRAKFRCMTKTETWDETTSYVFRPVFPHSEGEHAENQRFWKATPSGELELVFASSQAPSYRPGSFFYVDLKGEDGSLRPWTVYSVERVHEGQTNVCLHPAWEKDKSPRSGTLRMGLDNPSAFDWFLPGEIWSVVLEEVS